MTVSKSFFALSILGALTTSVPAWADIPPDDECFAAMVGKSCSNAMNGGEFQPGVCNETTCTRTTPDGAMTYSCDRCEPAEQGAGGQPNEAGAGGQATGAKSGSGPVPSEPKPKSDDGGGCAVAQAPGGAGALGFVLGALGLAIAGWRRRRSLPS
jgi:hypothetical protein